MKRTVEEAKKRAARYDKQRSEAERLRRRAELMAEKARQSYLAIFAVLPEGYGVSATDDLTVIEGPFPPDPL